MIWLLISVFVVILLTPSLLGLYAFKDLPDEYQHLVDKWIFLAPIVLLAKFFVILMSPLVVGISVLLNWYNLKFPFGWMGAHDDTIDGLSNGYPETKPYSLKKYFTRIGFLCRNPAYGFMYRTLGVPVSESYRRREPFWDAGKGIELMWSDNAVQARGNIGPLYVWFGWKIHTSYEGRIMFALDINFYRVRVKK